MGRRAPWDQRPGETAKAYARFLVYRNLGSCRTLRRAYAQYLSGDGFTAQDTDGTLVVGRVVTVAHVPGSWSRELRR